MKYLIVLLALGACASQDMVWQGGTGSLTDFAKDDYACRRDTAGLGGTAYVPIAGMVVAAPQPDMSMYRRCMVASGYVLK